MPARNTHIHYTSRFANDNFLCIIQTVMPPFITDLSFVIPAGIGIVALVILAWIIRLEVRIRRLLAGKNGTSLEDSIVYALNDLKKIHAFEREAVACIEGIERRLAKSIQAVETLRYNPFKGTGDGGNQSFATVLLSEKGNGVVLSSLYSRDRVSVFSKPISNFSSTFELSDEEKEALENAKKNIG